MIITPKSPHKCHRDDSNPILSIMYDKHPLPKWIQKNLSPETINPIVYCIFSTFCSNRGCFLISSDFFHIVGDFSAKVPLRPTLHFPVAWAPEADWLVKLNDITGI